jgi:hypothetical protein
MRKSSSKWFALLLLAVCVAYLRILLASASPGNYDQRSYEIVAGIMRRGGNVYAETTRYNYAPVWMHCLLALSWAAEWLRFDLGTTIRTFLSLVDIGNAFLIGAIGQRFGYRRPWWGTAAYLCQPLIFLLMGVHGQFDTLALTPVLCALWLLGAKNRSSLLWIWLLGTLAILIKQLTVIEVWALYLTATTRPKAIVLGALSGLGFLASFLPYWADGHTNIIHAVWLYHGWELPYGFAF